FAAEFAGRALISGTVSERGTVLMAEAPIRELPVRGAAPRSGTPAVVSYDPRRVVIRRVLPGDPCEPAELSWSGTIERLVATGGGVRVVCAEWPECVADLALAEALELRLAVGDRIELGLARA